MLANHNVRSSSRSWVHQFPMLIGALRLPDANGENLVCGNRYHLSIADLKDFAVKLWSELKILLSEYCFAVAWSSWALTLLPSCCLFAKKNFDGRNVINQIPSVPFLFIEHLKTIHKYNSRASQEQLEYVVPCFNSGEQCWIFFVS